MDKLNTFDAHFLYEISEGNPGCLTVLIEIMKIMEKNNNTDETIKNFFINIIDKKIFGARLWYIYKNEFNKNINDLLTKNLDLFTNEYFFEKFEKYV